MDGLEIKSLIDDIKTSKSKIIPPMPPIARERYIDKSLYESEIDQVFMKTWHLVGHTSEFPDIGSYRLLDLPFAPVFIVRGKDLKLRAFINSCAHRGSSVLKEDQGCAKVFVCQFHGWTYDMEGKVRTVPDRASFKNLDITCKGLPEVRCELWGEMIFINLDAHAEPLLDAIDPIARRFSEIAEASLQVISRDSWEVNCNWKIMEDAFRESYHVDVTHRESVASLVTANSTECIIHPKGHWTMLIPYDQESDFTGGEMLKLLDPIPMAQSKAFTDYMPVVGLFPNMLFAFQYGGFPLLQVWPTGIDTCKVSFIWFGMSWGDGERPEAWDFVIPGYNQVFEEDIGNTSAIQKSTEAAPGLDMPLSDKEVLVYQFHAEIDKLIGQHNVPKHLYVDDILKHCETP
ncbi:aromatic ring-hydroxylating dioxygenase subunit alpha [Zhongshania guokunii]|uniref:Aromatic ring-hydroxylating dioxygenase subunit alpha n=1 Tax=Zhongshania guokunii TaxID=641783 RepID=A0ABV3UC87_9GAMM